MLVELNKENKDKTVIFYCKKVQGSITVRYIDVDTNEVISEEFLRDTELSQYNISPKELEGYELLEGYEVIGNNDEIAEKTKGVCIKDVYNEEDFIFEVDPLPTLEDGEEDDYDKMAEVFSELDCKIDSEQSSEDILAEMKKLRDELEG